MTAQKNKLSEAAAEMGRRGGKAVAEKYGNDYMQKIGKNAAKKRWAKRQKNNDK